MNSSMFQKLMYLSVPGQLDEVKETGEKKNKISLTYYATETKRFRNTSASLFLSAAAVHLVNRRFGHNLARRKFGDIAYAIVISSLLTAGTGSLIATHYYSTWLFSELEKYK
jgi:hypothetical protein